jgi:hypothetical protein
MHLRHPFRALRSLSPAGRAADDRGVNLDSDVAVWPPSHKPLSRRDNRRRAADFPAGVWENSTETAPQGPCVTLS